ncbi:MAG: type IV pilin protein [Crocosphaera sp.]
MSHPNSSNNPLSSRSPRATNLAPVALDNLNRNYLHSIINPKNNHGFTLIELLVVILIVAVLSAMAFPQMLQMIGRSRESEARSLMGAMNRAQQAYFNEQQTFAKSAVELEVPVGNEQYYTVFVHARNSFTVGGLQGAKGKDNRASGTRDYSAAVGYDPLNRTYSTVVCRSIDQGNTYQILGLRSIDENLGIGNVAGAEGGIRATCIQAAGVETLEELR